MNLAEKIDRSKSSDKINFAAIDCQQLDEPLVRLVTSDRLIVEPIWLNPNDMEGQLYAAYIAEHPEYDGIYIRPEALKRLRHAADSLSHRYKIIVRAGHRPAEVQMSLLNNVMQDFKASHPAASDEEALAHARLYVSDPAIKLPPHCCGAALDIDLLDTHTGSLVDFGSPVNQDSEISHLHSELITPEQKANRLMLLTAMLDAGFASYYAEWWHYSYGDQIWAWFYGQETCLYGLAEV